MLFVSKPPLFLSHNAIKNCPHPCLHTVDCGSHMSVARTWQQLSTFVCKACVPFCPFPFAALLFTDEGQSAWKSLFARVRQLDPWEQLMIDWEQHARQEPFSIPFMRWCTSSCPTHFADMIWRLYDEGVFDPTVLRPGPCHSGICWSTLQVGGVMTSTDARMVEFAGWTCLGCCFSTTARTSTHACRTLAYVLICTLQGLTSTPDACHAFLLSACFDNVWMLALAGSWHSLRETAAYLWSSLCGTRLSYARYASERAPLHATVPPQPSAVSSTFICFL